MKFIFILLFAFPALASDLKVCQELIANVITPAVSFDEKSEDHGYRFVKVEKSAVKFIRDYDASKLGIPGEVAKATNEMNDCRYISDPKFKQEYCPSLFENYHFFQGLLFGMKNYGWSKPTIELGKQKLMAFVKETTAQGIPLIHVAMAYALLEDFAEKFPNETISLQQVKQDRAELEKAIQRRQMDARNRTDKCADVQISMKLEREEADVYRNKLTSIISKK